MSGRRTRPTTRSSVDPDTEAPTRQTRRNTRRNGLSTESMETTQSQPSVGRRVTRSGLAAANSDPVEPRSSRRTSEPDAGRQHQRRSTGHATAGDLAPGDPESGGSPDPQEAPRIGLQTAAGLDPGDPGEVSEASEESPGERRSTI